MNHETFAQLHRPSWKRLHRRNVSSRRDCGHARDLDEDNPLADVLRQGAAALKGMAFTAASADAILAPYGDVHDIYHRIKRERHSFEPHHNKALALIAEGRAGAWRDPILSDRSEGLALAQSLRAETPLMRYLKRVLSEAGRNDDVLVVLRYPEDVQQASDRLLDFLTEPGAFAGGIPNMRATTPARYAAEVLAKAPTIVVWAAAALSGARAYVGDSYAAKEFRLVVAGQDALTLSRSLAVVLEAQEYARFHERASMLHKALPWTPKDFGGLPAALGLDPDKPRLALPLTGQGYLLLDGYGKISASPGSQFYVLDPVSQQLHPREARSIDDGDAVFVTRSEKKSRLFSAKRMNGAGRSSRRWSISTRQLSKMELKRCLVSTGRKGLEREFMQCCLRRIRDYRPSVRRPWTIGFGPPSALT
jgi:hypothetical protein